MFESYFPRGVRPTVAERVHANLTEKVVKKTMGKTGQPGAALAVRELDAVFEYITAVLTSSASPQVSQHPIMACLSHSALDRRKQREIQGKLNRGKGSSTLKREYSAEPKVV